MMMSRLTLVLFCLLLWHPNTQAQQSSGGCSLIDPTQKAHYITYERMNGIPNGIRLRLHNNTNCNLLVETSDTENGLIHNGKLVDLHYLAANRREQTIKSGGFGDSVGDYELVGGYSLTFVVPFSFFRECQDVAVPFSYVWEKTSVGAGFVGGVRHYVYFLANDLSPSLRKSGCP
jgi:hypothetical protein